MGERPLISRLSSFRLRRLFLRVEGDKRPGRVSGQTHGGQCSPEGGRPGPVYARAVRSNQIFLSRTRNKHQHAGAEDGRKGEI